jgi:hypothetical protein
MKTQKKASRTKKTSKKTASGKDVRASNQKSKGHVQLAIYGKIENLISLGLDNNQVFQGVCTDHPEVIENDNERERATEALGKREVPDFDSIARQRLQEYIRSVRHKYNNIKDEEDAADAFFGRGQIASLDTLDFVAVERLSTHNAEIDWMYDGTRIRDEKTGEELYKEFGLPRGKISLWAGERGVGKTRTAIHITGLMNKKGSRIMFFQGEVALSEFRNWTEKVVEDPQHFWVSDQVHLSDQIAAVKAHRPDLVIVDSLQMIREAKSVSGLRTIIQEYKMVARLTNAHIVFIGHLNKGGTVKGNNDLEYLVDIVVTLRKKEEGSSQFLVQIPNKNRYGISGRCIGMMHDEDGVSTITTNSHSDMALSKAAKVRAAWRSKP